MLCRSPPPAPAVTRGEVEATVEFTGKNTFFGKTAQMLQGNDGLGNLQRILLRVRGAALGLAVGYRVCAARGVHDADFCAAGLACDPARSSPAPLPASTPARLQIMFVLVVLSLTLCFIALMYLLFHKDESFKEVRPGGEVTAAARLSS